MIAMEWLRPFVETNDWDYCVVWKLGDDPSRFIEWMGCCCNVGGGGGGSHRNMKDEKGDFLVPFCRDIHFQHPARTKACEALSHFPTSMPLYSGIHGEVVLSNQYKWINQQSTGTRVLIPVIGALIELFVSKQILNDRRTVELVTDHFNLSLEQEAISEVSHNPDTSAENYLENWPSPQLFSFMPNILVNQSNSYPSIEGSSSCSSRSYDHPSSNSGYLSHQNMSLKHPTEKTPACRKPKNNGILLKAKTGSILSCKSRIQPEKEQYRSKNLVTERNRRTKIKDGLYALRALVPNISKMDIPAIVGDAIVHIGELQKEVKNLRDELKEMEEEDSRKPNADSKLSKSERLHEGTRILPSNRHNQGSSSFAENKQMEVQLEVNQIGKSDFLIKSFCEHKLGGFGRLMEAVNSLGLQVADANITTFNGMVLIILKVEGNKRGIHPKKLKESLIELTG